MLRDEDSTARHLGATRRHVRRCRAVRGAAEFAAAIDPARLALKASADRTAQLAEAEEDAKDDADLRGVEAADEVRTLSGRAEEYDRENPGQNAHGRIFPDGGFGDYVASDGTVDDTTSDQLAKRVDGLGAGHALASFAASLRTRAEAIRAADAASTEALKARKLGEADEELAQAALRKAYEGNYLDSRKKLGRALAERLFPRLRRRTEPAPAPTAAPDGASGPPGPVAER